MAENLILALSTLAYIGFITWAVVSLARKRRKSPNHQTASDPCKGNHTWIPIGAQLARGEQLAYEQTAVLHRCQKCGHHTVVCFVGKWELGRFSENRMVSRKAGKDVSMSEIPPVDRSQRCLSDGKPETPDHREIDPTTGQQKGYIVLTEEERRKGFVRPVRRTYTHLPCGTDTTMGQSIAETYARDPGFYNGTFCCNCRTHFPLTEFVWKGTHEQVGS